jgi:hypothetical protein
VEEITQTLAQTALERWPETAQQFAAFVIEAGEGKPLAQAASLGLSRLIRCGVVSQGPSSMMTDLWGIGVNFSTRAAG